MKMYSSHDKKITILFGSKENDLQENGEYHNTKFEALVKRYHLDGIFYLKQTHSSTVFTLAQTPLFKNHLCLFEHEGDAIITKLDNIAIGVATADCMPLCIFDPENHAIGVVHAGWKGLSSHIISNTIFQMKEKFNTDIEKIQFFIGPSAHVCCYEIQEDFLAHFKHRDQKQLFEKRGHQLFFNSLNCATDEILSLGIKKNQIDARSHECTICNTQFCSYRRDNIYAGRQPTLIFLSNSDAT